MWGTLCLLLWVLGYSIKNQNREWAEAIYIFLKQPLEFLDFLTLENKLSLLGILQNCVTPLGGDSRSKTPRPIEIPHKFFVNTPGNFTSFSSDPWNFHMYFYQYLWKFHALSPHSVTCFDFFWNSPVLCMLV